MTSPIAATAPLTQLSNDEEMFRQAVRDFAEAEIAPRVHDMDARAEFDRALLPGFAGLGLFGIDVPEPHGGAGGTFFMSVLAVEELARVDASAAVLIDVHNTLAVVAVKQFADEALQRQYLPRLAGGEVGAYALSEASSGSDAFALECRAERRGDHWVLNGHKLWITNGNEADLFVVFATVDPSKGYKGITGFMVERGFPGFTVGKKEDKLGLRASSTTELIFEQCAVPVVNVIGEIGKGYKVAIETLNAGRIGIGAQMVGIAQGALDATLRYVKERKQFGKAIAAFQGVQFQLAQAWTELQAARLLVYNAARLRDAGQPHMVEGAMAKLYASQAANHTTSLCVDLYGGYGFTKDYPVEKYYRDAKIGTIYEGTTNMQLQTIAKAILKP
jgi:alkylation response protein AidB-like acyl-CoA dehydrogenase